MWALAMEIPFELIIIFLVVHRYFSHMRIYHEFQIYKPGEIFVPTSTWIQHFYVTWISYMRLYLQKMRFCRWRNISRFLAGVFFSVDLSPAHETNSLQSREQHNCEFLFSFFFTPTTCDWKMFKSAGTPTNGHV